MEKAQSEDTGRSPASDVEDKVGVGEVINESGHLQELDRQFSLLSICSIGITTGNIWAILGGSIVSQPLSICVITAIANLSCRS
jgi:hypothetical protein